MRPRVPRRTLSTALCLVYFLTNVAFLHAGEVNVWDERRQAIQLAALPTPAVIPAKAGIQAFNLPKNVLDSRLRHSGLTAENISLLESIPADRATINEVTLNTANPAAPLVVLIQDIHMNHEAQKNIGETLLALNEHAPKLLIGVEGAFEDFDFKRLRGFSDKTLTKKVADHFLRQNKIAAPSYAGIVAKDLKAKFTGIDDLDHYRANVKAYLDSQPLKKKLQTSLVRSERTLGETKRKHLSPALLQLDAVMQAFQTEKIGLGQYLEKLAAITPAPRELVVEKFLTAYQMEKNLDLTRVERDRAQIIEKLSRQMKKAEIQELAAVSMAYRSGKISFADYYKWIKNLIEQHGLSLASAPAFDNYIQYVILADGIKGNDLLEALGRLEKAALGALCRTPEETRLMAESRRLLLNRKLLDFALTPEEWAEYKAVGHEPWAVSFEQFYVVADVRSEKMVEKILNPQASNFNKLVLVVGGFHTPHLTQLLKAKGFSTAVVTPRITKVESLNGTAYLSVFSREKTPIDQLFQGEKLFLAPSDPAAGTGWGMKAASLFLAVTAVLAAANKLPPSAAAGVTVTATTANEYRVEGAGTEELTARLTPAPLNEPGMVSEVIPGEPVVNLSRSADQPKGILRLFSILGLSGLAAWLGKKGSDPEKSEVPPTEREQKLQEILKLVDQKIAQLAEDTEAEVHSDLPRARTRIRLIATVAENLAQLSPTSFDRYADEFAFPLLAREARGINAIMALFVNRPLRTIDDATRRGDTSHLSVQISKLLELKNEWVYDSAAFYLPGLPIMVDGHNLSEENRSKLQETARLLSQGMTLSMMRPLASIDAIRHVRREHAGVAARDNIIFLNISEETPLSMTEILILEGAHMAVRDTTGPPYRIIEYEIDEAVQPFPNEHPWDNLSRMPSTLLQELEAHSVNSHFEAGILINRVVPLEPLMVKKLVQDLSTALLTLDYFKNNPSSLNEEGTAWAESLERGWAEVEPQILFLVSESVKTLRQKVKGTKLSKDDKSLLDFFNSTRKAFKPQYKTHQNAIARLEKQYRAADPKHKAVAFNSNVLGVLITVFTTWVMHTNHMNLGVLDIGSIFLLARIILFVSVMLHEAAHLWRDGQFRGKKFPQAVAMSFKALHMTNPGRDLLWGFDITNAYVERANHPDESRAPPITEVAAMGPLANWMLLEIGTAVLRYYPSAPTQFSPFYVAAFVLVIANFAILAINFSIFLWGGLWSKNYGTDFDAIWDGTLLFNRFRNGFGDNQFIKLQSGERSDRVYLARDTVVTIVLGDVPIYVKRPAAFRDAEKVTEVEIGTLEEDGWVQIPFKTLRPGERLYVGSHTEMKVTGSHVSRMHARIELLEDGSLSVRDMASSNGTRLHFENPHVAQTFGDGHHMQQAFLEPPPTALRGGYFTRMSKTGLRPPDKTGSWRVGSSKLQGRHGDLIEDRAFQDPTGTISLVADGMSLHNGAESAQVAIGTFASRLYSYLKMARINAWSLSEGDLKRMITRAMAGAHMAVRSVRSEKLTHKIGTTLAGFVAYRKNDKKYIAATSLGDSMVFRYSPTTNTLEPIALGDGIVGILFNGGESLDDLMETTNNSGLFNYVGIEQLGWTESDRVKIREVEDGDIILTFSDGIADNLRRMGRPFSEELTAVIQSHLNDMNALTQALFDLALERGFAKEKFELGIGPEALGKTDDISISVRRVDESFGETISVTDGPAQLFLPKPVMLMGRDQEGRLIEQGFENLLSLQIKGVPVLIKDTPEGTVLIVDKKTIPLYGERVAKTYTLFEGDHGMKLTQGKAPGLIQIEPHMGSGIIFVTDVSGVMKNSVRQVTGNKPLLSDEIAGDKRLPLNYFDAGTLVLSNTRKDAIAWLTEQGEGNWIRRQFERWLNGGQKFEVARDSGKLGFEIAIGLYASVSEIFHVLIPWFVPMHGKKSLGKFLWRLFGHAGILYLTYRTVSFTAALIATHFDFAPPWIWFSGVTVIIPSLLVYHAIFNVGSILLGLPTLVLNFEIGTYEQVRPRRANGIEDAHFKVNLENVMLSGVFDGIGKYVHAADAAKLAARLGQELLSDLRQDMPRPEILSRMGHAFTLINETITTLYPGKAGTTGTLIAVFPNGDGYVINAGDSRAYLYRGNKLLPLTIDNLAPEYDDPRLVMDLVDVNYHYESGYQKRLAEIQRLSEAGSSTLRLFHNRHRLSQGLGNDSAYRPVFTVFHAEPGDRILLCSDGLSDNLRDNKEIPALLAQRKPAATVAQELVEQARVVSEQGLDVSKKDDITAVVIDVGGNDSQAIHPRTINGKPTYATNFPHGGRLSNVAFDDSTEVVFFVPQPSQLFEVHIRKVNDEFLVELWENKTDGAGKIEPVLSKTLVMHAGEKINLGRHGKNDIELAHSMVSRFQLVISIDQNGLLTAQDLFSNNGTGLKLISPAAEPRLEDFLQSIGVDQKRPRKIQQAADSLLSVESLVGIANLIEVNEFSQVGISDPAGRKIRLDALKDKDPLRDLTPEEESRHELLKSYLPILFGKSYVFPEALLFLDLLLDEMEKLTGKEHATRNYLPENIQAEGFDSVAHVREGLREHTYRIKPDPSPSKGESPYRVNIHRGVNGELLTLGIDILSHQKDAPGDKPRRKYTPVSLAGVKGVQVPGMKGKFALSLAGVDNVLLQYSQAHGVIVITLERKDKLPRRYSVDISADLNQALKLNVVRVDQIHPLWEDAETFEVSTAISMSMTDPTDIVDETEIMPPAPTEAAPDIDGDNVKVLQAAIAAALTTKKGKLVNVPLYGFVTREGAVATAHLEPQKAARYFDDHPNDGYMFLIFVNTLKDPYITLSAKFKDDAVKQRLTDAVNTLNQMPRPPTPGTLMLPQYRSQGIQFLTEGDGNIFRRWLERRFNQGKTFEKSQLNTKEFEKALGWYHAAVEVPQSFNWFGIGFFFKHPDPSWRQALLISLIYIGMAVPPAVLSIVLYKLEVSVTWIIIAGVVTFVFISLPLSFVQHGFSNELAIERNWYPKPTNLPALSPEEKRLILAMSILASDREPDDAELSVAYGYLNENSPAIDTFDEDEVLQYYAFRRQIKKFRHHRGLLATYAYDRAEVMKSGVSYYDTYFNTDKDNSVANRLSKKEVNGEFDALVISHRPNETRIPTPAPEHLEAQGPNTFSASHTKASQDEASDSIDNPLNQDFELSQVLPDGSIISMTLDGVGGYAHAEEASRLVATVLYHHLMEFWLENHQDRKKLAHHSEVERVFRAALEHAQDALDRKYASSGAGTTVVATLATPINDEEFLVTTLSLGDSELLYFYPGDPIRHYTFPDSRMVDFTGEQVVNSASIERRWERNQPRRLLRDFNWPAEQLTYQESKEISNRYAVNALFARDRTDRKAAMILTQDVLPAGTVLVGLTDGITDLLTANQIEAAIFSSATLEEIPSRVLTALKAVPLNAPRRIQKTDDDATVSAAALGSPDHLNSEEQQLSIADTSLLTGALKLLTTAAGEIETEHYASARNLIQNAQHNLTSMEKQNTILCSSARTLASRLLNTLAQVERIYFSHGEQLVRVENGREIPLGMVIDGYVNIFPEHILLGIREIPEKDLTFLLVKKSELIEGLKSGKYRRSVKFDLVVGENQDNAESPRDLALRLQRFMRGAVSSISGEKLIDLMKPTENPAIRTFTQKQIKDHRDFSNSITVMELGTLLAVTLMFGVVFTIAVVVFWFFAAKYLPPLTQRIHRFTVALYHRYLWSQLTFSEADVRRFVAGTQTNNQGLSDEETAHRLLEAGPLESLGLNSETAELLGFEINVAEAGKDQAALEAWLALALWQSKEEPEKFKLYTAPRFHSPSLRVIHLDSDPTRANEEIEEILENRKAQEGIVFVVPESELTEYRQTLTADGVWVHANSDLLNIRALAAMWQTRNIEITVSRGAPMFHSEILSQIITLRNKNYQVEFGMAAGSNFRIILPITVEQYFEFFDSVERLRKVQA